MPPCFQIPQAQDARVLGAGGKHIPHLVAVMVQVRWRCHGWS